MSSEFQKKMDAARKKDAQVMYAFIPYAIAAFAKTAGLQMHPWKPIVFSTKLMLIALIFALSFRYLHFQIIENAKYLNHEVALDSEIPSFIRTMLWFFSYLFLTSIICSLIHWTIVAPFKTKDLVKFIEESETHGNRS